MRIGSTSPAVSRAAAFATLATCSVAACSSDPAATGPTPVDVPVTVDRARYVAERIGRGDATPQYAVRVVARLRNLGTGAVGLEACRTVPIFGVEQVRPADRDGSAFSPVWACPGAPPIVLPPGAQRVDTLVLRSPNAVSDGRVLGAPAGTVRLVYPAVRCPADGPCRGEGVRELQLRSAEFVIALP